MELPSSGASCRGLLLFRKERIAGPLRALRDSGPSLRGARGFTPLSRLSPPLSHAIGSVIMLGIAYERDASVHGPDVPNMGARSMI